MNERLSYRYNNNNNFLIIYIINLAYGYKCVCVRVPIVLLLNTCIRGYSDALCFGVAVVIVVAVV